MRSLLLKAYAFFKRARVEAIKCVDWFSYSMDSTTYLFLTTTTTTPALNRTGSAAADLAKTLIPEKYQIILLSFAYGIISLLAVVGNSCIIYIVLRNRRMHSVTNYFICNLALADCLVACFAVPFQVCLGNKSMQIILLPSLSPSFKLQPFRNGSSPISSAN